MQNAGFFLLLHVFTSNHNKSKVVQTRLPHQRCRRAINSDIIQSRTAGRSTEKRIGFDCDPDLVFTGVQLDFSGTELLKNRIALAGSRNMKTTKGQGYTIDRDIQCRRVERDVIAQLLPQG